MERAAGFVALIAFMWGIPPGRAEGLLRVCPTCPLHSLTEAVHRAQPGDRIQVAPGTYLETGIVIDKPLLIEGMPQGVSVPIIDGQGKGNVITVNADHVSISGLTVQNSGFSYVDDLSGIEIENAGYATIANDNLLGNFFSIHVEHSHDCLIEGNRIRGANRSESAAGNGIHVWYADKMMIRGNDIRGQRDGIYFEFVKNSQILHNFSQGNLRYGLHFMFSDHDEYDSNTFSQNASGVAVMYSRFMKMSHNVFEKSWGGAAYGILLKEMTSSSISENTFRGNTVGVYMEGTDRSIIEKNEFVDNGWALRVLADNDANTFTHNNFIGNTFDASTNSSSSRNTFDRNYWDAYRGLDIDHDGIGDTPYRPVKLSSVLMENYGTSVLLLKSFFFSVADQAESALPVLTPEAFRDDHPLMKRYAVPR